MKKTLITIIRAIIFGLAMLAGIGAAAANENEASVSCQIKGSGSVWPNLNKLSLQGGRKYSVTAVPAPGSVFSNWLGNGTQISTSAKLVFTAEDNLVLQANFVPSPFSSMAGTYSGLFYCSSNASALSAGSATISLTTKGNFAIELRLGRQTFASAGILSAAGGAAFVLNPHGSNPLTVQLQVDGNNSVITGSVNNGVWTSEMQAYAQIYSKKSGAPQAGKYTLLIPGNAPSSAYPGGNGFGSVTVYTDGRVTFSGNLGDGTAVSSSGNLVGGGFWPLYISLYGGKGSILGWLTVEQNDVSGQVGWFKLPQASSLYPAGFSMTAPVIGSPYHFTNGLPILGLTEAQISLTNGNLSQPITKQISLSSDNLATNLVFRTSSGLFKGTVTSPSSSKAIPINGVVLQRQKFGAGVFLGSTETGSVLISSTNSSDLPAIIASTETEGLFGGSETNDLPIGAGLAATGSNVYSNPFVIYDQSLNPNAAQMRLGYWRFDNATLANENGVSPLIQEGVAWDPSWSGHSVAMTSPGASSQLSYPVNEGGATYFNPTNGTIRFWYQPNWSSTSANAPTNVQVLFNVGDGDSFWNLYLTPVKANTYVIDLSIKQGSLFHQPYTFQTGTLAGAQVSLQSNLWYQIALTYTPTNVALYTNGTLLATGNLPAADSNNNLIYSLGNGALDFASASALKSGFTFGSLANQSCGVEGQLCELETFNYALTAPQISAGFPTFGGNSSSSVMSDVNYVGRSDMLQRYVDRNPAQVVPTRLGYWRFNSQDLSAEQGQIPFFYTNVSLASSWSGSALNISSVSNSAVSYWDVFTNGWANINCRNGSLRFWYKPNVTGGSGQVAPFVYLGSPNGADIWELALNSDGRSISFVTGSNGNVNVNLTAACNFSPQTWAQITLNYGPTGTSLYINGQMVSSGSPVTCWPSLTNRSLGMVIGNNTAYNDPINGQFDEMETFNYQLEPANILTSFQTIQAIDSDLNGIPDLMEDILLPAPRSYLGFPVAVAGTIEAEQFDMGGPGVGYYTLGSNAPCAYRPTGMFITNCDDLGLGFCLDQTRAGEWVVYSINVLVPQTYSIDTRVAGIGTNGVFECEFSNGSFYTNTGLLTIASTNWNDVSGKVYLPAGTNVMKLHFLSNGSEGNFVGRFNYISVHPWWQPGFNSTLTNIIAAASLSTNNDWTDATNNAAVIQRAIKSLPATGGTVLLPGGIYYVSQATPCETNGAFNNFVAAVVTNNVEIRGEGETNTTLIAWNRATTFFAIGSDGKTAAPCANVILRDFTMVSQRHLAVLNGSNTTFEIGQLNIGTSSYAGAQVIITGCGTNLFAHNILITNCQFSHGDLCVMMPLWVSNCLISHCGFTMWGGKDIYTTATNNFPTNTQNTTLYNGSVAIFVAGGPDYNVNVSDCTYNGNTNLTVAPNSFCGCANTNFEEFLAPDGFIYFQSGGNHFISHNNINNYQLEGIQLSAGPNAVVGNSYNTLIDEPWCCALAANRASFQALSGTNAKNYSTCFVGNSVYGGRNGQSPQDSGAANPFILNFSGNALSLFPPFAQNNNDYPGAAVCLMNSAAASILGNTLLAAGHGVVFAASCGNALIMDNDFSNAAYRGIGITPNLLTGTGGMQTVIVNNLLGQGSTFHVQIPFANSSGWFIYQNEYINAAGVPCAPALDPVNSGAHLLQ